MKNSLLVLIICLLVSSCADTSQNTTTYQISGEAPGVYNGMRVYLKELNENGRAIPLDTAVVMNETFEFTDLPVVERSDLQFVTIDGVRGNLRFMKENHGITLQINKDKLEESVIVGGPENDIFYGYAAHDRALSQEIDSLRARRAQLRNSGDNAGSNSLASTMRSKIKEKNDLLINTIKSNPRSPSATYYTMSGITMKQFTPQLGQELFNNLAKEQQESPMGKAIATNLKQLLAKSSALAVGTKAPEFAAPDQFGNTTSLKDAMGKYTLIDFWASWCGPCRRENPNVVRAYNKYHKNGFNIISVSLDRPNAKQKWIDAIKKDKMEDWYHISNLQWWQDPIAKSYSVRSIPASFLIDEDGNIVATNLRGAALDRKLEELL